MSQFPSLSWFRQAAKSLENDEDFRRHGRWLRTRVALRVDQDCWVMHFDRGLVLDVQEGMDAHDFLISGTAERWDFLFRQGWGLVRLYRTGTLEIRGDAIELMKNWKAFFFIAEGLKRHHALGAA
ncbi:MAG: SCP2 sterol-binding domain-containing protein [Lautropia sp.]